MPQAEATALPRLPVSPDAVVTASGAELNELVRRETTRARWEGAAIALLFVGATVGVLRALESK
jgi:hypothetical protein